MSEVPLHRTTPISIRGTPTSSLIGAQAPHVFIVTHTHTHTHSVWVGVGV